METKMKINASKLHRERTLAKNPIIVRRNTRRLIVDAYLGDGTKEVSERANVPSTPTKRNERSKSFGDNLFSSSPRSNSSNNMITPPNTPANTPSNGNGFGTSPTNAVRNSSSSSSSSSSNGIFPQFLTNLWESTMSSSNLAPPPPPGSTTSPTKTRASSSPPSSLQSPPTTTNSSNTNGRRFTDAATIPVVPPALILGDHSQDHPHVEGNLVITKEEVLPSPNIALQNSNNNNIKQLGNNNSESFSNTITSNLFKMLADFGTDVNSPKKALENNRVINLVRRNTTEREHERYIEEKTVFGGSSGSLPSGYNGGAGGGRVSNISGVESKREVERGGSESGGEKKGWW